MLMNEKRCLIPILDAHDTRYVSAAIIMFNGFQKVSAASPMGRLLYYGTAENLRINTIVALENVCN